MADVFGAIEWSGLLLSIASVALHIAGIVDCAASRKSLKLGGVNGPAIETVGWRSKTEVVRMIVALGFGVVFFTGVLAPPTPSQAHPVFQTWLVYFWLMASLAANTGLGAYGFYRLARVRRLYAV